LEQQVVGGEQAHNEEVKKRRQQKRMYAENRKKRLAGECKHCLRVVLVTQALPGVICGVDLVTQALPQCHKQCSLGYPGTASVSSVM